LQVDVQFHAAAQADFVAWVRTLGRTAGERVGFAEAYLDDMIVQFLAYDGRPPRGEPIVSED
jgi:hypothetical protein